MLLSLIKAMRLKQWVKNGFIFAPLIFDRQLNNWPALGKTIVGFFIFSLLASTVYIINDINDVEADRKHPKKKNRPFASGALPINTGWITAAILLVISLPSAYIIDSTFFFICMIYFFGNLSYSTWLKHVPLLDVLLLAGFYVIRVGAGVTLIQVERFSPWIYLFTTFLALYVGIGKRRSELAMMAKNAGNTRKVLEGYTLPFLDQLIIIVSGMTLTTYGLYTFSAPNLPENHSMMLTIPFLIYGIFRYLYLVQVIGSGDAPDEVLFSDRPLQTVIVLWGLAILVIFYVF